MNGNKVTLVVMLLIMLNLTGAFCAFCLHQIFLLLVIHGELLVKIAYLLERIAK